MSKQNTPPVQADPPGAWRPARLIARRALAPVERFLAIEASSGILLLLAAAAALVWANSPWRESYVALWHVPLGINLGSFRFERDLHFWINDGLMTIFFFVVGLEIRREIFSGELSELRRAALPLAAALGGMLMPAALYFALNHDRQYAGGWGVPMATDIAFAVGALTLLGKRVPPALRILLLALAVIDDIGAILVIAVFYSAGFSPFGFAVAAAGYAGTTLLQKLGVRNPAAYIVPAIVIWAGAYVAGIHPTLAGVIVGLMTPFHAWYGTERFIETAAQSVSNLRHANGKDLHAVFPHLADIEQARREAVSPGERLQHALHGWVAFGIMPLFALANAGVPLGEAVLVGEPLLVFSGVALGLVLGKPIGVLGMSWLSVRLGLASLPRGVTWSQVSLVGVIAGIGFTMALFIAALAFPPGAALETAKLAILVASGTAALLGLVYGRLLLSADAPRIGAQTEAEAEASTTD